MRISLAATITAAAAYGCGGAPPEPPPVVDPPSALRAYVVPHSDADPGSYDLLFPDHDGVVRGFQQHLGQWQAIDFGKSGLPRAAEEVAPTGFAWDLMSAAVRLSDGSVHYVRESLGGAWSDVDVSAAASLGAVNGRLVALADPAPSIYYVATDGTLHGVHAIGDDAVAWTDAPVAGAPAPRSDALSGGRWWSELLYPGAPSGAPVVIASPGATPIVRQFAGAPPMAGRGVIFGSDAQLAIVYPIASGAIHRVDAAGDRDLSAESGAPPVESELDGDQGAIVYRAAGGHVILLRENGAAWVATDLVAAAGAPPALGNPVYLTWQGSVELVAYLTADGHVHALEPGTPPAWTHVDLTAQVAK